ncbi:DUF262 domain-containing protein [Clostridium sporogenes]|uniref:DUF262 domain-containing protein n=3 Tax=Clostridium sporogenes TaxID=1509 RepID=UPI000717728D|nr:DUF262 domain-containing protein [Clostridium sporogenes]KRU44020.1 hypothetical protein VT94_11950 [Clostridium sporogenes]MBY7064557.1 DUF262 domain-containing protein [Clostridium sporogenes]MBY7069828.1 DUF262 domain-containing protein [Clostridium sporogenes]NFD92545.1 DUF262 domain-containing protein [Clostridium sporogenes]NFE44226.1 DUF262 domain-containing protein [Clostridium sporogenes]
MSKIHAEDDKTIKDLLESNSLVFKIPINQRKFSWENEQLEMFWEDLKYIIEHEGRHYLGVLSLIIKENADINFNCYEIIDGQQRMTTIVLLVSALRDVYCGLRDESKAKKIQENFLSSLSTRKCCNKLEVSKLDSFTFNKIVNINVGEGTEILLHDCYEIESRRNKYRMFNIGQSDFLNYKMYDAYKYFFNEIVYEVEKRKTMEEKKNYLLDVEEALSKLDVILIKSEDIESMFLFFESLNNRGLQLSKMDIVRNTLLKIVAEKYSKYLAEFGDLWDELIVNLDGYDEIKFLKYYFMCTSDNKIIQEKELPKYYERYFRKFVSKNDLKMEIEKMIEYSLIYIELFTKEEVSTSDSMHKRNIKMINQLGQQACHSFLMEYIYWVNESDRLDKISNLIENMMFRRIICAKSTKQLDGIFRNMIKQRSVNEFNQKHEFCDEKIIEAIQENTPSDIEFSSMLKERIWEKNDITSYFFRKIEYKLSGHSSSKEFVIKSRKEVHIEHILPINFKSDWPEYLGLNKDKSKYDILNSKLGNLILLEFDINTSIKDSLFNIKIEKYKKSKLEQVKDVVKKHSRWNENEINLRTDELINMGLDIWKIS